MKKTAFTMLELIFVIVIMGILAKFGTEIFLKIYNAYATTAWATEANEKTQTAIEQISNRLRERIPESVIATAGSIQWVGRDVNGWNAGNWSGIADIGNQNDSNATLIETPGTLVSSFSANNFALYFIQNDDIPGPASFYTANGSMHAISGFDTSGTRNAFTFANTISKASEFYTLSEYAYKLDFNTSTGGKLMLSRWKPWNGSAKETFVLADGINRFSIKNFKGNAGGFIVTLCQGAKYADETDNQLKDYSICKQKFIF